MISGNLLGCFVRKSSMQNLEIFDIIELSKSKGMIGMKAITAHSSQLTAHANYVIKRLFCRTLKQVFSHFCEKAFFVVSEREMAI